MLEEEIIDAEFNKTVHGGTSATAEAGTNTTAEAGTNTTAEGGTNTTAEAGTIAKDSAVRDTAPGIQTCENAVGRRWNGNLNSWQPRVMLTSSHTPGEPECGLNGSKNERPKRKACLGILWNGLRPG